MKKTISVLLSVLLLCALVVPAAAADVAVAFTADSAFTAGSIVTVDEMKTRQNIMDVGNSDEYNAALEGNMQYYWFRNDSYYLDGPTLTLTEEDRGCQFFCRVYLFSDADRINQCGVFDSGTFSVPNPQTPEITTQSLPDGTVGEAYYQKLECTDPDVVYSLLMSTLPEGLYLTQHGEIEGTPNEAGTWQLVILAAPSAGENHATTREFALTVAEAPAETAAPTEPAETEAVDGAEGDKTPAKENKDGVPVWVIVLVAVLALGLGVCITLLVVKRTPRKKTENEAE